MNKTCWSDPRDGGASLRRDKPLSFHWRCPVDVVDALGLKPDGLSKGQLRALRSVLLDAAIEARGSGHAISYPRRRAAYTTRYQGTGYTFAFVLPAIDFAAKCGLFEQHVIADVGRNVGVQSWFLPGPELREVPLEGVAWDPVEVLRLKDTDGNLVDYKDTSRTGRMSRKVLELNEALSSIDVDFSPLGTVKDGLHVLVEGRHVCTIKRAMYRVFNAGRFDLGGRFYGPGWQQIGKEKRARLVVNGTPVQEADCRSLHPSLLYAQAGKRLDGDPYDVPGYDRDGIVKPALNTLINADDYQSARCAIAGGMAERRGIPIDPKTRRVPFEDCDFKAAGALIDALKTKHESIRAAFHTGAGLRLQYQDAELFLRVADRLMLKQGIPILGVHDSAVTEQPHIGKLAEAMEAELARLGIEGDRVVNIVVVPKTSGKTVPHMEGGPSGGGGACRPPAVVTSLRSLVLPVPVLRFTARTTLPPLTLPPSVLLDPDLSLIAERDMLGSLMLTSNDPSIVGPSVQRLRLARGWTQDYTSALAGVRQPHLANIEGRRDRASRPTLMRLLSVLLPEPRSTDAA